MALIRPIRSVSAHTLLQCLTTSSGRRFILCRRQLPFTRRSTLRQVCRLVTTVMTGPGITGTGARDTMAGIIGAAGDTTAVDSTTWTWRDRESWPDYLAAGCASLSVGFDGIRSAVGMSLPESSALRVRRSTELRATVRRSFIRRSRNCVSSKLAAS